MIRNEIHFKYYDPKIYYAIDIVSLVALVGSIYYFLENLDFPTAIMYIFIAFGIFCLILYMAEKLFKDLNGSFIIDKSSFEISTTFNKKFIPFSSLASISKEYYDEKIHLGVVSATQANPGLYRITLRNAENYTFKIAKREEQTYINSIKKLERKIFKTNRFGVYLTANLEKDPAVLKQRNEQFEAEKPLANFSLEIAINELLKSSGLALNDLTN